MRSLCKERNTKLEGRFIFKANFPGARIITMSRKNIFFPSKSPFSPGENKEVKERAFNDHSSKRQ